MIIAKIKRYQVTSIDWVNLKVLILDVDGTLYNQSKLRKKMLFRLLKYYLFRPFRINELLILYHFRVEREKNAGYVGTNLESQQYEWCADRLNIPVSKVKAVISKWIFESPNSYLAACLYPDVQNFINLIRQSDIKIAIYSDYDALQKLKYLNIDADLVVASTDQHINSFKPNPGGLNYIMKTYGCQPKECLFIGDRQELDGLCAAYAGVPFLLIENKKNQTNKFYSQLMDLFKPNQHKR